MKIDQFDKIVKKLKIKELDNVIVSFYKSDIVFDTKIRQILYSNVDYYLPSYKQQHQNFFENQKTRTKRYAIGIEIYTNLDLYEDPFFAPFFYGNYSDNNSKYCISLNFAIIKDITTKNELLRKKINVCINNKNILV